MNTTAVKYNSKTTKTKISPIKAMSLLAENYPNSISLGWGLPSFDTPLHIKEAVREALLTDENIGKYPSIKGLYKLRTAISEKMKTKWQAELNPENEILITVGAQQAVLSALQTIVDNDDEVIIFSPYFPSYIDQIVFSGGKPVSVNLIEHEKDWSINFDEMERAITPKTKAIIVNNPNNPTGKLFTEIELRKIAEIAIKHNIFVISDETYNFLTYNGDTCFNLFRIPELKHLLIGCYSFSKEYAMTGWRIGYMCANAVLINEVLKFHDASVITVPRISQVAAIAALKNSQDCVSEFVAELDNRRDLIFNQLREIGDAFEVKKPKSAYYIFPKFNLPEINSHEFALRLLQEANVVVVPGSAFGEAGENHIRLCFGSIPAEIIEGIYRISNFINRNYKNH